MDKKIISFEKHTKESLLKRGKKAIYEGDIKEALNTFEKLYDMDSSDTDIIYNLAAIYIELGNNEKSEELLLESFNCDPNHLFTLIGLANIIYYNTGSLKKALIYLDIAQKNHKDSSELNLSYGNLYMIEGKYKTSLSFYKKAYEIDPVSESVKSGLSMISNFLGLEDLRKHQFLLAMKNFKEAVKLNPNWISPHLNIIRTLSYEKSYKRAFHLIEQLKDKVNNLSIDYVLKNKDLWSEDITHSLLLIKISEAKLFYKTKNFKEADAILKKVITINPEFPGVNYLIALIATENNQFEDAQKYIRDEQQNSGKSIKVKILKYVIYKKSNKVSSWKNYYFNMIKKDTFDIYIIYDSAMILKKFECSDELEDMLKYANSLNPMRVTKLKAERDVDLIESIDFSD